MADPRLKELVSRLIKKTDTGELKWEETAQEGTYQVSLPDYTIWLYTGTHPETDNDVVWVRIKDAFGRDIERFNDEDIEDPKAFHSMTHMWQIARRQALGVDEAIDRLLSHLKES